MQEQIKSNVLWVLEKKLSAVNDLRILTTVKKKKYPSKAS